MREKYPHLLVFKEKHSTRYFHVASLQDEHDVFVKIFRERLEEGYWYQYDEPKPLKDMADIPKDLDEQAQQVLIDLNKERVKFNRKQKQKAAEYDQFQKAVAGDLGAILDLMHDRSDCQYEEYEVEYYESIHPAAVAKTAQGV